MDRQADRLDPFTTVDWDEWLGTCPGATVFHTRGWARVLVDSYGHRPVYLGDRRVAGSPRLLPLMEVRSALTGRRGVSLPFSDECVTLDPSRGSQAALWNEAVQLGRCSGWRYVESRDPSPPVASATPWVTFLSHTIDLQPGGDRLFDGMEPSVRRAVRKAEKGGVSVEMRRDSDALAAFCRLHGETRKRHGAPPQPAAFFENLLREVIAPGHGWVVLAQHEGKPVAASVFLHFGRHAVYKYGASARADQSLRANNLVMWSAMRWYASQGFAALALGRTSVGNAGLARFKRGFGAREASVNYWRYDFRRSGFIAGKDLAEGRATRLLRLLPLPILRMLGQLLYRHLS